MKKKTLLPILILCCMCAIALTSAFSAEDAVFAENVNVSVSLDGGSLLAAYSDIFAYTKGKTLSVAKDNKVIQYEEQTDFDKFTSLAMNGTDIVAIARYGDTHMLFAYQYDGKSIQKISYTNQNFANDAPLALYADEHGNFYAMNKHTVLSFDIHDTEHVEPKYVSFNGLFAAATDFCISDKLYCIIDGNLYEITKQNLYEETLDDYLKREGEFTELTISGERLLLLDNDEVSEYSAGSNEIKSVLTGSTNADSKLTSTIDKSRNVNYVYIKSNLNSVNIYEYVDGTLNYYSSFDTTVYTHPEVYDVLKAYKTGASATVYSSPRHLQVLTSLPTNAYILVLNEVDSFYYVYYYDDAESKVILGYIRKSTSMTYCPAVKDNPIGMYAQPLHANTPIYKYPIDDKANSVISYESIYTQLIVVDNVAQDGDYKWGWYKVGYIDGENNLQYGYVKELSLSPFTALHAPVLSKSVKLTSPKLGEYVKIYSLPDEQSAVVTELAEGSQVYLKAKYDKKNPWTTIIYEGKTAYVKTVNVKPSGLTSWQLALAITVPAVVVALALTVTILLVVRKRKLTAKN